MIKIFYFSSLITLLVLLGVLIYLRSKRLIIKYENEYNKGIDAYANNKFKLAIKHFKTAVKLNPTKSEIYYNLALAYMDTNKFNDAEINFKKTIELNHNDPDSYYNLGLLYYAEKKYNDAAEQFFKFIQIKNDDPDSYYNLGLTQIELNKFQDAYDNFNKAITISSDNIEYIFGLAKAYDRRSDTSGTMKDIDAAIESYLQIVVMDSMHEEANYRLAICYAKKGMWEESVNYCKKVIEINNKSAEAHNQLGLALYCRSDIDTAIIMYKKSIALNPAYTQAYYNLGYALEKHGNFKEAIETFNKYIDLTPAGDGIQEIKEHIKELKESIDIKLNKIKKTSKPAESPVSEQIIEVKNETANTQNKTEESLEPLSVNEDLENDSDQTEPLET